MNKSNIIKKKHAVLIGSLGALISSLCCLGPLILVLLFISLGISSFSAVIALGKYKIQLIILGIVFIGIALWLYFRKKESYCNLNTIWANRYFIIIAFISYIITFFILLYILLPIVSQIIFENL